MAEIKRKPVTMWELFYDLIFVYAVSQMTKMIGHLHNGHINLVSYGLFLLVCVFVIQAWTYQTIYINKYGEGHLFEVIALLVNMIGAIYVAISISTVWESNFYPFNIGMLIMLVSIFAQYLYRAVKYDKTSIQRKEINAFLFIIGTTIILVTIALMIGYQFGIWLVSITYLFQDFSPLLVRRRILAETLNFPHLVERTGLITIIFFGESIVALTNFFKESQNFVMPLLIFAIIVAMFATYILQTEDLVDHTRKTNGQLMMHLHQLIPIGIVSLTAGWEYLYQGMNDTLFINLFLLFSIAIYYSALNLTSYYNKKGKEFNKTDLTYNLLALVICLGSAIIFNQNTFYFLLVLFLSELALLTRIWQKIKA